MYVDVFKFGSIFCFMGTLGNLNYLVLLYFLICKMRASQGCFETSMRVYIDGLTVPATWQEFIKYYCVCCDTIIFVSQIGGLEYNL